jgi:hypothetical protein
MLRKELLHLTLVASALGASAVAACDSSRDRPTGLGRPVPPTTVAVVQPASEELMPVDSTRTILVEADGLLVAVELYVTRRSIADTIVRERRDFATEQSTVEEAFDFLVPRLLTGTHLEISAVAEDIIGQRYRSEPVFVQVIDCDQFPLACGGI